MSRPVGLNSPGALPRSPALGARLLWGESGCRLPDANLHCKRSSGLLAGPLAGFPRDLSGEASSPFRPPMNGPVRFDDPVACPQRSSGFRLLPGDGSRFWRDVGPGLRVLPLTPQVAFSLQSVGPVFSPPEAGDFPEFAVSGRSPSRRSPCASRFRIGTFRRGGLARKHRDVPVPVATMTSVVTGFARRAETISPGRRHSKGGWLHQDGRSSPRSPLACAGRLRNRTWENG
jgi:hypothetical protein